MSSHCGKYMIRIMQEEEVNGDQLKSDYPGTDAVGFTSQQFLLILHGCNAYWPLTVEFFYSFIDLIMLTLTRPIK